MARSPSRKPKPVADVEEAAVAELAPAAPVSVAPASKPAGKLFSVTRTHGAAWDAEVPMEQQADWEAHAAYMNGLEADGFVVLGGPLEDTPYTMLAVRAEDVQQARARFAADPWEASKVIETTRVVGWDLALGAGKI
jgi:uncharacterized protein YciI